MRFGAALPSHRFSRLLVAGACAVLLTNAARVLWLPESGQSAVTNALEAMVAALAGVACLRAGQRSSSHVRGLWSLAAAHLALLSFVDFLDLRTSLEQDPVQPLARSLVSAAVYVPLGFLVVFPVTASEDRSPWSRVAALDFAQTAVAIIVAHYVYIYAPLSQAALPWHSWHAASLVPLPLRLRIDIRNGLLCAALLARAGIDPLPAARAFYRRLAGPFLAFALARSTLNQGIEEIPLLLRPAALLLLAYLATRWRGRPESAAGEPRAVTATDRTFWSRWLLALFPAVVPVFIVFETQHIPALWHVLAASLVILGVRTGAAEHQRVSAARLRHRHERALAESEARLRRILENLQDAFLQADLRGRLSLANPSAARMFGYATPEEMIGLPVATLYADPLVRDSLIQELLRSGRVGDFVSLGRRKDGRTFWVSLSAQFWHDGGRPCGTEAVVRDISGRVEAEEHSHLLSIMLDEAPAGVTIHDLEGRVLYVNHRAAELHGHEPEALRQMTIAELVSHDDRPGVTGRLRRVAEHGEASFGVHHLHRDGTAFPVHVRARRVVWQGHTAILNLQIDLSERKRAEDELRASTEQHRLLIEHMHAGVVVHAADTEILLANPQACTLLGLTREQIVGRAALDPGWSFVREDGTPMPPDEYPANRVRRSGQPVFGLVAGVNRPATGDRAWVLANAFPEHGAGGQLQRIVVTFTDISELKRVTEELALSEARYRGLFERSPIGIYRTTPDGRVLVANPALLQMLGYESFEELASRDLEVSGFDTDSPRRAFKAAIERHGEVRGLESVWITRHGQRLNVRESALVLRDASGGIAYYEGTVENVTERRRAEQALRDSEEQYRLLFDSNPSPMFVLDRETLAFLAVNEAACSTFRYGRREFLSMTVRDLHLPAGAPMAGEPTPRPSEDALRGTRRLRRKDGAIVEAEVVQSRITFEGRRAWLSSVVDVTEKKALEAQLRQAQKLESMGLLAGGVAHDFNNILGVIIANAGLLQSETGGESGRSRHVGAIMAAANRAAGLTRQLLAFSRRQVLQPRIIDVNAVVDETEKMLSRLIGEDVELVTDLAPDLGAVEADPGQLQQALINLAVNARDAMPHGGRLSIATRNQEAEVDAADGLAPGRYVAIVVRDTGLGMTADVQVRIFEPFFTTKESGRGTGLGLSMVHGIVTQSGGYVRVASTPGQGTAFEIYLPRAARPPEPEAIRPPVRATRPASQTILIVEDEQGLREVLHECLEAAGYSVLSAPGGDEALAICARRGRPVDLLVTDLVMPRMSGRELVERLQTAWPDLHVLFMSGYTDDAAVLKGGHPGGADFIQKPFTGDDLSRAVDALLARREPSRSS